MHEKLTTAEAFVSFGVSTVIAQVNICAWCSSKSDFSVFSHFHVTYTDQSNFKFCVIKLLISLHQGEEDSNELILMCIEIALLLEVCFKVELMIRR